MEAVKVRKILREVLECRMSRNCLFSRMISLPPLQQYDQQVVFSFQKHAPIRLTVRRFDQLHPEISGNKWFKLLHWLKQRKEEEPILSFGGAYSNHLLALSAAAHSLGIKSIGIVRGEEVENPWIRAMKNNGMHLEFIDRSLYREKNQAAFLKTLTEKWGSCCIVPEGGAGQAGMLGAEEMVNASEPFHWVILPGGTGTTAAGIARKLLVSSTETLCFQVLKGKGILEKELLSHGFDTNEFPRLHINSDFHFGGYAKSNALLIEFQQQWMQQTHIPIDRLYGAKALFGMYQLYSEGFFEEQSLLYIHTGGLGPA
jgi:1-aminocyclopropane-1-carboxylate deaminase